jgi:hypothetical protein
MSGSLSDATVDWRQLASTNLNTNKKGVRIVTDIFSELHEVRLQRFVVLDLRRVTFLWVC